MADFSFSVVRADDLLALSFRFVNLRFDQAGTVPQLVRITAGQPAFIVVGLPPQHFVEQVFEPIPAVDSNPFVQTPPVPTLMAGPSRLAFRVPDTTLAIPFTLDALLDWNSFLPSVSGNALPDPPGLAGEGPGPAEPSDQETGIELPYALVLSPDATGRWGHSIPAVTRNGVTELWHTRLGVGAADGSRGGAVDERTLPSVRALGPSVIAQPHEGDALGSPLDGPLRAALIRATSDFSRRDGFPHVARPITATHVTLTALGAFADLQASWDPGDPLSPTSFTDWRQVVALGRDQEVRKAEAGVLFPFGHRAALVEVVGRELQQTPAGGPGTSTDVLMRRTTLVVLESERDYDRVSAPSTAALGDIFHQMPLRRVRLTSSVVTLDGAPGGAFVPAAGGQPFLFHLAAQDWAGGFVDLAMPLVFVPDGTPWRDAMAPLQEAGPVPLRGQQVALGREAPAAAGGLPVQTLQSAAQAVHHVALGGEAPAAGAGATTLPVQALQFAAQAVEGDQHMPFFPYVSKAHVRIPVIDRLVGSASQVSAVTVTLTNPDSGTGQIFAQLADGPLALGIPTDKAGGLVTPNLSITGLSRTLGPVPPVLAQIAGGTFNPRDLFSASGLGSSTLLGGIRLTEIISSVADLNQMPALVQSQLPGRVTTTFAWQPQLRLADPPPSDVPLRLNRGAPSVLAINATTSVAISLSGAAGGPAPTGEATAVVTGSLTNFALDFGNVVTVAFRALRFTAEKGKKVSLEPKGINVTFQNELQFLNELADIIPAGEFGDGAELTASPQGVVASYSLGLPSAGAGIFSLENIAFSAAVSLPFVERPASLRLAFSERAHPFLVTVAMIGGGGFFAIELDTTGVRSIEGAIELGANISIDLLVVSANVHVLGGFYFAMKPDHTIDFFAYLRIGGAIELLGIAGVSIEIYLAMTYEPEFHPPSIGGRATVTIGVRLLMFTKTITMTAERHFAIPAHESGGPDPDPAFSDLMTVDDWRAYCRAFA